jgi:hypothetical protein
MPLMKPPKDAIGIRYNGIIIELGDSVNVSIHDVEALKAEGWEITGEVEIDLSPPTDEVDDDG